MERFAVRKRSKAGIFLDVVGWFVFFGWMAAIVLLRHDLPDGAGALGVGILVLLGTLARKLLRASLSVPWLIIGFAFLVAGIGGLMKVNLPLTPIALIICGVLMLFHHKSERR